MVSVVYGGKKGKKFELAVANDMLVVRTASRAPLARASLRRQSRESLVGFTTLSSFPFAGVEVLATSDGDGTARRDRARTALKQDPALEFAGRVLVDPKSYEPSVYTENLFVKFEDRVKAADCSAILSKHALSRKARLGFAKNAYFVAAAEGTGLDVFPLAERLLNLPEVEYCHPELVRRVRRRKAFPGQWHLKSMRVGKNSITASAHVAAAWRIATGRGICVAIIDDGFDLSHPEFSVAGKVVHPRDVTRENGAPLPGRRDDHGTACAGVAVATGRYGASGVAPAAKLMPIRCTSALGSIQEANAFEWAADHGADVISCSWGPWDGDPDDPTDPLHAQVTPLPDSTRLAIDYAVNHGRRGKGCVVFFAAGNGNESVDNDGYASYAKVVAVAACTDAADRSYYSDHGRAVWCAFPSSGGTKTPGIFTTDRRGGDGYNPGRSELGDRRGDYTNDFGGTSSACPGAAGTAALMLSANPRLSCQEVRQILRDTCEKIDRANGGYDANGRSPLYGYGRIDAAAAVKAARARVPTGKSGSRRRKRGARS